MGITVSGASADNVSAINSYRRRGVRRFQMSNYSPAGVFDGVRSSESAYEALSACLALQIFRICSPKALIGPSAALPLSHSA